jgi:hypothetical protein
LHFCSAFTKITENRKPKCSTVGTILTRNILSKDILLDSFHASLTQIHFFIDYPSRPLDSVRTTIMKISHIVLLFTLFGHTSARLKADDAEQDQTRALGNGNGNNGNGNGNGNNGNGNGPEEFELTSQVEEAPLTDSQPPASGMPSDATPPLVLEFAAGDDDDELDILVTFKNNNGKAKAKGKAKKVNQELRLGDIIAMRATKKEIREMDLDADIK